MDEIDKHLRAHVAICLELAKLSNCSRRKFGAVLYDPGRKQSRGTGYNGGPRGGGRLCGGEVCLRACARPEWRMDDGQLIRSDGLIVRFCWRLEGLALFGVPEHDRIPIPMHRAETRATIVRWVDANHPADPIPSGTRMEIGCHHAEANVIANAAHDGTPCAGLWLIVNGEPCLSCAKLIHHAGITRVVCVAGGYAGKGDGADPLRRAGVEYLEAHYVAVQRVEPDDLPKGAA